tara:strand:+ start:3529 stop:4596 length:1068 start_codon:yes stop_codon:yes gene_type:complete
MTYKETLFFIAKCLTVSLEKKNKEIILTKLKSQKIDWEKFVKLSTNHLVLPAIYCNFQRSDLLNHLPKDLVSYMKQITSINRNRNKQIIKQAKTLNKLLLKNDIKPIFLKGTGNLLSDLYVDVSERMVGDIDFIFSEKDYFKAIKLLRNNGYSDSKNYKYSSLKTRHYKRIKKKNNIAAVEIHHSLLPEKYANEFNYKIVQKNCQVINGINVLSHEDNLNLSIISCQINDDGFYFKTINLRNAYDVYLLSKQTNAQKSLSKFEMLKNPLNCFLATCYVTFGNIESLQYNKTKKAENYLSIFDSLILSDKKRKFIIKLKKGVLFVQSRLEIIFKSIYSKEHRDWILNRTNKGRNWD